MEAMTKRRFVEYLETAAQHGIEQYRFFAEECPEDSVESLTEQAVDQVVESASCYAGIGSCGGGGCKH